MNLILLKCLILDYQHLLKKSDTKQPLLIPIRWCAPEVFTLNKFSIKSDVWSFGIVLYEIFTFGKEPYENMTRDEVIDKVSNGYRIPHPQEIDQTIYTLMQQCWSENPNARLTMLQISTVLEEYSK